MRFWLLAALLLAVSVPLRAQDIVIERLSKVGQFAFGHVGYAGVTSQGEKDFKTVLARKSAVQDFNKLFAEGNIQAKCYALVGIRKLDPKRFQELSGELSNSTAKIEVMKGCIVSHVVFADVFREIAAGKYSDSIS